MSLNVTNGEAVTGNTTIMTIDDLITSAMCAILDRMEWRISLPAVWTAPKDPLEEMDRNF